MRRLLLAACFVAISTSAARAADPVDVARGKYIFGAAGGCGCHTEPKGQVNAGGKKFERVWDAVIQAKRLGRALPVLENVLSGLGRLRPSAAAGSDIPAAELESRHREDGQPVAIERAAHPQRGCR